MKNLTTLLALPCLLWLLLAPPAAAHWPTTVRDNIMLTPDPDSVSGECTILPYADNSTLVVYKKWWLGVWYQIVDRFGNLKFPYGQPATPANLDYHNSEPQAVPDDQGGGYIIWGAIDSNPVQGIVAQHVDSLGNRLWGDSGIIAFPVPEQDFEACSDSQGGLVLAVSPDEGASDWTDLYAQRVDSQGNLLWGPNGVLVCGIPISDSEKPRIAPDGEGGCFITWYDSRVPSGWYMQRLDGDGNRLWGQDLYVSSSSNSPYGKALISDGVGGVIMQAPWGNSNNYWRVNGAGQILWALDDLSWTESARIMPGEPGFFYIGFSYASTVYGQKIDLNGNIYWPAWPANYGAIMYSNPGWYLSGQKNYAYYFPYFYGIFANSRSLSYGYTVLRAQALDSQGHRVLGEFGVVLTDWDFQGIAGQFKYPNLRGDSEGGFAAVWELFIGQIGGYIHEVCAKHVNADGTLGGPFPLGVTLTPHNPPIQIPASGGSFTFDVAIADTDSVGGIMDAWIEVTLPNGSTLEILARNDLTIQPNGVLTKNDLQQFVPSGAPAGIYTYALYAGNYPYQSPWGQDSFTFEKMGARGWGLGAGDSAWRLEGWDEPAPNAVTSPKPLD